MKEVISIINRACAKNKISIVVTGDSNLSSKGVIPRPIGGTYLKHIANVIVCLKNISASTFLPSFKATLVKHQYMKTPKSVVVHGRKYGRTMLLNRCSMGGITPSFRQLYDEVMSDLRTELQGAFVDLGHKKVFDLLLKAWNSEQAAMSNSTLPTVCDKLNVVASVHNRKLIAALMNESKQKDLIIQDLENKIIELQNKTTYQENR